jgi:hypothetical protein
MNQYVIFVLVEIVLFVTGTVLSILISTMTCAKTDFTGSTMLGFIWSLFGSLIYILTNWEYTSPYVLPAFIGPLGGYTNDPSLIGKIYAMLLMTAVTTAWLFYETDKQICVSSKDELRAFSSKLGEELKKKTNK